MPTPELVYLRNTIFDTTLIIKSSCQPNRVEENVLVISPSFPHGKSSQTSLLDVAALDSKRSSVVERNHDFGGFVVDIRLKRWSDRKRNSTNRSLSCLTASVIAIVDTRRWVPFGS